MYRSDDRVSCIELAHGIPKFPSTDIIRCVSGLTVVIVAFRFLDSQAQTKFSIVTVIFWPMTVESFGRDSSRKVAARKFFTVDNELR